MNIEKRPYELQFLSSANAKFSSQCRKGDLYLLKSADGVLQGVSDGMTWSELGDLEPSQIESVLLGGNVEAGNLPLQIQQIKNGFSISTRDLLDVRPLFSHTLSSISQSVLIESPVVKLKVSGNLEAFKNQLIDLMAQTTFKIRLDFNGALSFSEFEEWLEMFSSDQLQRFDFIEDPFAWNFEQWESIQAKYPVSLALDHANEEPFSKECLRAYKVRVVKPAKQNLEDLHFEPIDGLRVVFTGNMGHPFGLMLDRYWANHWIKKYKLPQGEVHGLDWPQSVQWSWACKSFEGFLEQARQQQVQNFNQLLKVLYG